MIIYKITNLVNNKVYVGITTTTLKKRWQGHLKCYRQGDNRHLYCAMRKYGIKNLKIEQIDTAVTYDELLNKEKYYIKLYDSKNNGYNMTEGGESNPMEEDTVKEYHDSKMRSAEVRDKISKTMKSKAKNGTLFTKEHLEKLSLSASQQVYFYKDNKVTHTNKNNTSKINQLLADGWLQYEGKKSTSKEKKLYKRDRPSQMYKIFDTRSVGCYCILEDGTKLEFHSYLDAGKWWYDNYKPFGEIYSEATYQRKIKKSIRGEPITYSQPNKKDYKVITNIRWFKERK